MNFIDFSLFRFPIPESPDIAGLSRYTKCTIALALAACMMSGHSYAKQADNAKEYLVDCGLPNSSLQDAIDSTSGPTTIFITGICSDATITTDDITLNGGPGGTIEGTIRVVGASGIVIEGLVVSDAAGDGIDILDASSVKVQNTTVSDNGGCGISVRNASFLKIVNSSITGHTNDGGLCVSYGSVVRGEGNTITGNWFGTDLYHGTYIGIAETIDGTSGTAVETQGSSYVEFRAGSSTITGDVSVFRHSMGKLQSTQVNGNINVFTLSYLEVRNGTNCGGVNVDASSVFKIVSNGSGNCSPAY